jgi:hypothetical protein
MILLLAMVAQTSACSTGDPVLEGPAPITFQNGRFGAPRASCPATELVVSGGGNVTADTEGFYGNVRAFALLEGSYRFDRYLAAFVELEVVRWQTVISSLSAETLGFGHTSLGATYLLFPGSIAVSGTARLTLPTVSNHHAGARSFALEAALSFTTWTLSWLEVHGQLGMLGSAGFGDGPLDPRGGLSLVGGATWRPASWFALIADVALQLFYGATLDHIAIAGGPRLLFSGFGIDLFVGAPLAGRDRTTVSGLLRLRYDFR